MTQRDGQQSPFGIERCGLWRITLILEGASGWVLAEDGKTVSRADLEKVASQSTVEITTTGRKSSKPHTKPVWFVYDQGHFYLQSGKEGKSDWYLNLKKNPQLSLKIGALSFSGRPSLWKMQKKLNGFMVSLVVNTFSLALLELSALHWSR